MLRLLQVQIDIYRNIAFLVATGVSPQSIPAEITPMGCWSLPEGAHLQDIAGDVEHITMLQRSPTYVVSRPDKDAIANMLRKLLGDRLAYRITRFKNIELQRRIYEKTRSDPEKVKRFLLREVRKQLGPDYDVETHLTPRYDPWDPRLCLIPNADLFDAIKAGKASVVTDHVDRITKKGIRLVSGEDLEADIIVVNKYDRVGSEDALRDVRKQYRRSRNDFETADDVLPVFE